MTDSLKKILSIRIKRLDMFPNHFFGITEINGTEYKINIQGQSILRKQLIKLLIKIHDEKALLRLTGIGGRLFEDLVNYAGESEWVEIDSNRILYYFADNPDKINNIDVYSRF
ncbi:MAG: hypothetical protein OEL52_02860 [Nitrosopumilus sp.]|nr:hypothetical protein [Nitrosopumilus sp.]